MKWTATYKDGSPLPEPYKQILEVTLTPVVEQAITHSEQKLRDLLLYGSTNSNTL